MKRMRGTALLVGANVQSYLGLQRQLSKRGWESCLVCSCQEALTLLAKKDFDLVISGLSLSDGKGSGLIPLLTGRNTNLFFYLQVEDGCWWLPAIRRGKECWGAAAIPWKDFGASVETLLEEAKSDSSETFMAGNA
ncbi:MAG: hypothetical protein HY012_07710 [Acidobacteria bacterium]|nr:hypothetical protein [Acidobacteriota bacterium]